MNTGARMAAIAFLALSVFLIGTAELLPMGLLLPIAGEMHITIPVAGILVSGYALRLAHLSASL